MMVGKEKGGGNMKKLLGTLSFWAIVFFGPCMVMLWNQFSYSTTGAGYETGSFLYIFLRILSQPLACLIAYSAIIVISGDQKGGCVSGNCIVCAIFTAVLAAAGMCTGNIENAITMAISVFCCLFCYYLSVRNWKKVVVASAVTLLILSGGLIARQGTKTKESEKLSQEALEAAAKEAYSAGYDSGYTDGIVKLESYKFKNNSPDGNSVKEISVYVKNQYGITPSEAAEIVWKYNNPDGSGYPTWAVYQNALLALVYAGGLIGY